MLQLVSSYDRKACSVSHQVGPGIKMCYYSCWLAEVPELTSLEFALLAKDKIFTDRSSVWILLLVLWLTGSVVWGKLFNLSVLSFSICKQGIRPNSTQYWEISDSMVWQRLLMMTKYPQQICSVGDQYNDGYKVNLNYIGWHLPSQKTTFLSLP